MVNPILNQRKKGRTGVRAGGGLDQPQVGIGHFTHHVTQQEAYFVSFAPHFGMIFGQKSRRF
jgi:hypothetical protein